MGTPVTLSYRKRLSYHAAILGMFALFASTGLMMSYLATKDDISQRHKEDLEANLKKVIPNKFYDNDIAEDRITLASSPNPGQDKTEVFLARQGNNLVAVAYQVIAPDGYSGPIVLMLGIDIKGNILGTRVITHAETPGLGDKIEIEKDDWILKFDQRSLGNTPKNDWQVKKDGGEFDQFSGATITPRAIVKAIHKSLIYFNEHKTEILDKASQE